MDEKTILAESMLFFCCSNLQSEY